MKSFFMTFFVFKNIKMMSSEWFHIKIRKIIKYLREFLKLKYETLAFEGIVISSSLRLFYKLQKYTF